MIFLGPDISIRRPKVCNGIKEQLFKKCMRSNDYLNNGNNRDDEDDSDAAGFDKSESLSKD